MTIIGESQYKPRIPFVYDRFFRMCNATDIAPELNTVLLTLGRLPVALEIARSFAAIGWRVVVAEPFGLHLLRHSRSVSDSYQTPAPRHDPRAYRQALCDIIEREQVALVVPVSEETLHVAALAAQIDCPLYCPPPAALLTLHDKLLFNKAAHAAGLSVPRSCALDSEQSAILATDACVVKPRLSCSGRGVVHYAPGELLSCLPSPHRTEDPEHPDQQTKVPSQLGLPQDSLVQQAVEGQELSSLALARDGQVVANVVYRANVRSGSVAVVFERVAHPAISQWVDAFVAHQRHTGFIGFDFIIDAQGVPYALECNPRANSGIHFFSGSALAKAILDSEQVNVRAESVLQESYSTFTTVLGRLTNRDARREAFGWLRRARDVTWSRDDPWPFLLMTINTWPLIYRAIRHRQTFAEVAALDLEYSRE
ncbi:MAG: ATP-grasp domain-containing protein [Pseudomonadota bacterium]